MNSYGVTNAVMVLGQLALRFGRVDRITFHEDGTTPESDTDHTVMLGLIACALAPHIRGDLDVGLIAQYALVHDLVEAYAGDTPTLRIDAAGQEAKKRREHEAYLEIAAEFSGHLPWVPKMIAEYESRRTPEARYVKALDKLLPKITHVLNDLATIRAQGMDRAELEARYERQYDELHAYAADFPELFELRADLVDLVLATYGRIEQRDTGGPACLGASRGVCEGSPTFQVVYRRSKTREVSDAERPWCFRHGLEHVDRAHAAASMAHAELVPIPSEMEGGPTGA